MEPAERVRIGAGGPEVTRLGFGGAALGNLYAPVPDEVARATVEAAWSAGVRYFDTAPLYGYGLSESRLGEALRGRPRNSFVVSTKVGRLLRRRSGEPDPAEQFIDAPPLAALYDYSYDGVLRSFESSLRRLGLERVDIVLIHDPGASTHGEAEYPRVFRTAMEGGMRALHELRADGRLGAIGLGVMESRVCLDALRHHDLDCFLLACRYTLLEQTPLDALLPECKRRGIAVIAGGAFSSGILADEPRPGATHDYVEAGPEILQRARHLHAVCTRHGVPLGAAALQLPLLHPAVVSVIPGARSPREVEEHADWLRRPIPDALWAELKSEGLLDSRAPTPGA